MKYIDFDGNRIWLVPGTEGDYIFGSTVNTDIYSAEDQWHTGLNGTQNTVGNISNHFNEATIIHNWYGNNHVSSRQTGGQQLAAEIIQFYQNPANAGQPIRIITYSHGGNLGIEAINILAAEGIHVDTFITIGTPSRGDSTLNNSNSVRQWLNVYNNWDAMRTIGGTDSFWQEGGSFRLLFARRRQSDAQDIRVTTGVRRWRFWHWLGHNHGMMHNDWSIWEQYILPHLHIPAEDTLLNLENIRRRFHEFDTSCNQG